MTPPEHHPLFPVPFEVRDFRRETMDTFSLRLRGASPFHFEPGQFNMTYVFGVGDVPISISGDPARPEELIHTIRSVGSVTSRLAELRPGDTLGIRGPFGTCWPLARARGKDLVLVAGGIGVVPLRPVIYYAASHREDFESVHVLVGARTPDQLVFRQELDEISRDSDINLVMTVDSSGPEWEGEVGLVTDLISKTSWDPANAVAMVCGPEIMMRFVAEELLEENLSPEHLFVSMERNMKCAVGFCGHCQFGPEFICKDGPVLPYSRIGRFWEIRRF